MNKARTAAVELGAASFVPLISSFLLAVLMLLPLGSGVANVTMPHLAMIAVFYWITRRPMLMQYGACAAVGLCLDLWLNVPLGLNMLLLILARMFVLSQLKHFKGRNNAVHWVVFVVLSFGLYFVSWLIISAVNGVVWPVRAMFIQWLVTAFSYAPIGFLLGRLRRSIFQ
ncbi:MAG: rod shape-determining protein MreD [Kordiimonadaceae bacterium]|nr:rod shape-determining protein MreD [Kordiimonadaceae bacterium]